MSAGVGSRILGRVGARPILVTGFLLGAGGLALLARLSPTSGYLDLLPSLVLIGTGMGGAFVSVTSSAVAGVPQEDTGVASALLNASQQIGGSLGLAILTAVATARFDAVAPRVPTPAALASATTSVVCVCLHRRRPAAGERGGHRRVAATPASCRAASSRRVGRHAEPGRRGSADDPLRMPWMTYR